MRISELPYEQTSEGELGGIPAISALSSDEMPMKNNHAAAIRIFAI
jgi:hypothetical protein